MWILQNTHEKEQFTLCTSRKTNIANNKTINGFKKISHESVDIFIWASYKFFFFFFANFSSLIKHPKVKEIAIEVT